MGQGDTAVRAQGAVLGAPSFTPMGQEQMSLCLSPLLAPGPRAGQQPRAANLPSMAQPAQAASAAPALHCSRAHRGAPGAQPPPPAAASSKQSQTLGRQGRKIHPSLPCMALLHSTPVSPAHPPCHQQPPARQQQMESAPGLGEHLACCSSLIPQELSTFLTGTGSPPACPDFLTRISPLKLKPHSFKE